MRVLVTGGTGVIGLGVIPLLEQKGIDVGMWLNSARE
jgi:nucleoside-diphosphate-sugar epimerase